DTENSKQFALPPSPNDDVRHDRFNGGTYKEMVIQVPRASGALGLGLVPRGVGVGVFYSFLGFEQGLDFGSGKSVIANPGGGVFISGEGGKR
ncbi:hypothetical protein IFM89_025184, partial [Coptis chinensis]